MGLATLAGFDSAANLAEEAKNPYRSVPRAIVGSVVAAGVLGLVFLITLTVAIGSIPSVTDSDSPVAAIIRDQLGPVTERIFLIGITLVWVMCALFVLTVPAEALVPDLIVVGLVVAGGLFFLGLLIFRREALETER
jgi:amino acid transporter